MDWLNHPLLVFALALAVDRLLGEPPSALHPVVWMGAATRPLVRWIEGGGAAREWIGGVAIAALVPGAFALGAALLLAGLAQWPWARLAAAVWLLKSSFALRALREAVWRVRDALRREELPAARRALASLCSRDAAPLGQEALAAAAIESAAENASDSVVAPLLFFAVLGAPGAVFYRAVNTMDALIGYRGRYEFLGKAAARLDDVCNFVPARVTAWLILAGAALRGGDWREGWRIARRDHALTASPNAGWPMSAMAGLLGVRLEKAGHYALGDRREPVSVDTIRRAWRFVDAAALLGCCLIAALLGMTHAIHALGQ
jgi:adenosylcobinamide-phosphate synthase